MNNILDYNKFLSEGKNEDLIDKNGKRINTSSFVKFIRSGTEYKAKVKNIAIEDGKTVLSVKVIIPREEKDEIIEVSPRSVEVYM
jgi:predicted secreted Zn-dependent protease